MMNTSRQVLVLLCFTGLTSGWGQQKGKLQLTARELFYNAQASAAAAPATPAPASKPKVLTAGKTKTPPKPASNTTKSTPETPPPVTVAENQAPPATLPGGARIVKAAATNTTTPLGLKYTILKAAGDSNEMSEVAPSTVFHTGDHIRFNVEANGSGYLYIFSQGSSGTWQALFPSAELKGGSNQIEGFQSYTMPPGHRFTFDEQAGTEKLFLVLSRAPVPDLENLMYSLKTGRTNPVSDPKPAATTQGKTLVAGLKIDDSTVGRLRQTYSRDLIIEKVDENTPGDRKEKAVYVVNPNGSPDAHVVADLLLVHQ